MPKKAVKKKASSSNRRKTKGNIETQILENLVALQKVHIDLAGKFDKLSKEISSLLTLFESAARSFGKHPGIKDTEKDKEFLGKIDKLLDQNKTIAKGLTLMESRVRERVYGQPESPHEAPHEEEFKPPLSGRPLPKF